MSRRPAAGAIRLDNPRVEARGERLVTIADVIRFDDGAWRFIGRISGPKGTTKRQLLALARQS